MTTRRTFLHVLTGALAATTAGLLAMSPLAFAGSHGKSGDQKIKQSTRSTTRRTAARAAD